MSRSRRRLSSEIFASQVLILVLVLLVGALLAVLAVQRRLDREHEHRALGIARSVAAMPEIARAVAAGDRRGIVQRRAEAVRRSTGVAFVVVADRRGIRYSHPRPALIGRRVSTDPSAALAGHTVLAVERGASGRSARARIPLRAADGRIVGIVNVGVLESAIRHDVASALPIIALYGLAALAVGLIASMLLARRLKRRTFGLELDEIADLVREREGMLHGIREGVVGIDAAGRLRVINDEARRLLDLPPDAEGRAASDFAGQGRLGDLLAGGIVGEDLLLVHGERVLLASRMQVRRDGRDLGAIVSLRDRTELEALARELDSVQGLTDAMRAQAHEYSNRLHTLSGLLQLRKHDEAAGFIQQITHADDQLRRTLAERVADPHAAALLLAKSAVAAERGVALRLAPDTRLAGDLTDPPTALTVIGNLVDNALDAARGGNVQPWVEVALITGRDGALRVRVADSGPGVPADMRERIFEPGWSTKPESQIGARGVGLTLVRRILERHGGSISVDEAGDWGGAVVEAVLPEAVRPHPAPTPPAREEVVQ